MKIKCDYCNNEFSKIPSMIRPHNFCSRSCFGSWISKNKVKEKASNYRNGPIIMNCLQCNTSFSTYIKKQKYCSKNCSNIGKRKRISLVCANCNISFEKTKSFGYWHSKRGHDNFFCSNECCTSFHSKENHPNWIANRNEVKDINKSLRWSSEMVEWRKLIYVRDNYTCQMCGRHSGDGKKLVLNAHHIIKLSECLNLALDVNNGITLCEECHKLTYYKEQKYQKFFHNIVKNNTLKIIKSGGETDDSLEEGE